MSFRLSSYYSFNSSRLAKKQSSKYIFLGEFSKLCFSSLLTLFFALVKLSNHLCVNIYIIKIRFFRAQKRFNIEKITNDQTYLNWQSDLVLGVKSFWVVKLGFGFSLTFWVNVSIILNNLTASPKQIPNLLNILLSVRSVFMCSKAKPSTFSATNVRINNFLLLHLPEQRPMEKVIFRRWYGKGNRKKKKIIRLEQ